MEARPARRRAEGKVGTWCSTIGVQLRAYYSPGDMQPPQQYQQLHSEVEHEPAVVPLTHAVLDPGAVVIVAPHAVLTRLAVLGSHWLLLGEKTNGKLMRGQPKFNIHTHVYVHMYKVKPSFPTRSSV